MASEAMTPAQQRLADIEGKITEFTKKRDAARAKGQRLKADFDRIKKTGARPIAEVLRSNSGILIAASGLGGSGVGLVIGHAAMGTAGAIAGIPIMGAIVSVSVARFGFNATLHDIETTKILGRQAQGDVKEFEAEIARQQELQPLALERVNEEERLAAQNRAAAVIVRPSRQSRGGEMISQPAAAQLLPVGDEWEDLEPTAKQIGYARHLGIRLRGTETRGIVSQMIDVALSQRNASQPTHVVVQTNVHLHQTSSRGVAMLFNIFWPGMGQIYQGRAFTGLFFMIATPIGYLMLIIPGMVMHLICILDSAFFSPRVR